MKNNIENKKVIQSNNLVRDASWTYDKIPLILFKALVSCIDTSNPPKDNTIIVKKSDLVRFLDPSANNYTFLKEKIRILQRTSIKIVEDKKHEVYVNLISKFIWTKESDIITVEFSRDIMPYLVELKGRFLSYPSGNLTLFSSKYGLILYENLLSMINQYHNNEYVYDVSVLRRLTGTEKTYDRWQNFETNVLKTAIDDINSAGVEILVDYKKIKDGKNIDQILFYVAKRTTYKEKTYAEAVLNSISQKPKRGKAKKDADAIAFQEELDELIKSLPL